jgi:group I intron endonuclease
MNDFTVYMHINKVNGKRYVGITHFKNLNRRWINGKGYFRNKHFADAIQKYGWNNFEHLIIEQGLDKESACELERRLIKEYDTQNKMKGYNITDGGEFFRHTEESKKLMSLNRKGKGLHVFSEEHKRKISEHHGGGNDKKQVLCVETGMIYESINDAARAFECNKKLISNCCRKIPHYNTAKGYHWEFV